MYKAEKIFLLSMPILIILFLYTGCSAGEEEILAPSSIITVTKTHIEYYNHKLSNFITYVRDDEKFTCIVDRSTYADIVEGRSYEVIEGDGTILKIIKEIEKE